MQRIQIKHSITPQKSRPVIIGNSCLKASHRADIEYPREACRGSGVCIHYRPYDGNDDIQLYSKIGI